MAVLSPSSPKVPRSVQLIPSPSCRSVFNGSSERSRACPLDSCCSHQISHLFINTLQLLENRLSFFRENDKVNRFLRVANLARDPYEVCYHCYIELGIMVILK